jgi:hypothetical protein
MQLKHSHPRKTLPLRRKLMAASYALLGATAVRAQEFNGVQADEGVLGRLLDGLTVDSALAYYHEDGRVQAVEPVVDINKAFANGQSLELNATFDVLSGASPNGALTSRQPQTFASPSGSSFTGKHTYIVNPGQYPVDPNYSDVRAAVGASWNVPFTRLTNMSFGGKISGEDDFISVTVDASIAHDFNEKNTTLSIGVSNEFDRLNPVGGAPVPGSNYDLFEKTGGAKTKDGVSALLGVTQVMARNWIAELNLSVDRFKGYLNDPYKISSVLDAAGATTGYVYESRPEQRTRKSVYLENRAAWNQFSAALSLRYMQDNWQVRSDTAELRPRWTLFDRNHYIEPTFRWYRQSAAYFYTPWLLNSDQVEFQSSDERLGAFHALTYGVKYEQKLHYREDRPGSEFSVRLEYYQQTFNQPSVPTALQGLNLLPALKSILVQVGWRY